jgi:hypothetical protein
MNQAIPPKSEDVELIILYAALFGVGLIVYLWALIRSILETMKVFRRELGSTIVGFGVFVVAQKKASIVS